MDLVAEIKDRSDNFDFNPSGPSPRDFFRHKRRSETVKPNRNFVDGMEIGSYQLNTASALSSVFNGNHRRASHTPLLKPIENEIFAEKKKALEYQMTNTRDLSLGQNTLEMH